MPNWCENELVLTGPKKVLVEFKAFASSNGCALDVNRFVPYPKEFRRMDEEAKRVEKEHRKKMVKAGLDAMTEEARKAWCDENPWPKDGYNSGGREWCILNWGTKWGCSDVSVQWIDGGKNLFYGYLTAWAPFSENVLRVMAARFPKLRFELSYDEPAMCFKGKMVAENGVLVNAKHREYGSVRA